MNKLFTLLFPASRIKSSISALVVFYGFMIAVQLTSDFNWQRYVLIENKQTDGVIVLKGIKYVTSYQMQSALVKFDINNPLDFLLLNNGDNNNSFALADSFAGSLLKLGLSIFGLILIARFDFTDPFNPRHLKQISILCNLTIVVIFFKYFNNWYNVQWVNDAKNGVAGYKYTSSFDFIYYIVGIWVLRMVISFYQSGVKIQREMELTI